MIVGPRSPREGFVNVKRFHKVKAVVDDAGDFIYTIRVSAGDKDQSWEVEKMHSALEALQNGLLKQGLFVPLLPHKRNTTNDPANPDFVERKRQYVSSWLKELFTSDDIKHSADFKRFFQQPAKEQATSPEEAPRPSETNWDNLHIPGSSLLMQQQVRMSPPKSAIIHFQSDRDEKCPKSLMVPRFHESKREMKVVGSSLMQGVTLNQPKHFSSSSNYVVPTASSSAPNLSTLEQHSVTKDSSSSTSSSSSSASSALSPSSSLSPTSPYPGGDSVARLKDFTLLKVIGKGSFGKVLLVRKNACDRIFAMKVLQKDNVIKRNQVEHTRTERSVLQYIRHPFIVTLRYAFQSHEKLYFVLDYCPGGELFFHLGKAGRFSETRACFYAAQMVLALEYLHQQGIVYRDLKPENVLLDANGDIALTDFGLSKEGIEDNVSANSFCGTPEYLAPEILTRVGHGRAADWWSLGALLFEMLTGMPPFYSRRRERLFQKILKAQIRIPKSLSPAAQDIVEGLLTRDPHSRLGSHNDADDIKSHPFFESIDWQKLYNKELVPPFQPTVEAITDTNNFDDEFTTMALHSVEDRDTVLCAESVSEGKFAGFTFVNTDPM